MPDPPDDFNDRCVARCKDGTRCERDGECWTLTTSGLVRRTCTEHDDPHQPMIPIDKVNHCA